MSTALQCSSCNAPLPVGVSDGLCPTCLAGLLRGARRRRPRAKNGKWPRRFGEYELLEKFGMGGMGVVYKARQRSHDRVVALKMIRRNQFGGEHEIQRFRSEAEAVARLDHPHIVPLYEVGEHRGRHFFSMLFIESGSLMTHLPRLAKDQRKSAQIMATVARAIHYAHQHGILHRDLKPANILLDGEDQPYVSDFGLAKDVGDPISVTQTGAVLGTPSYMAPEQAAGKHGKNSPAADVYSLGAILYELLSGQPPFAAETPLATLKQLQEQEPRPPGSINRKVNPDLETICLKCLEKDPQKRYPTAEALALDLERVLRDEPIDARPIGRFGELIRWARRRPALAGVIVASALLLLAVTIGSLFAAHSFANARDAAEQKLPKIFSPNQPPVVVLMDARARRSVYDDDIFKNGGTNADVLLNVLQDLPVSLPIKETLLYGWDRENYIIRLRPDLVVIHKSAILHAMNEGFNNRKGFDYPKTPETPDSERDPDWLRLLDIADERLILFLGVVGSECPHTKFLVYSRGTDGKWPKETFREQWVKKVELRFPRLEGRIKHLLVEGGAPGGSFKDAKEAKRIHDRVQEILFSPGKNLDRANPQASGRHPR